VRHAATTLLAIPPDEHRARRRAWRPTVPVPPVPSLADVMSYYWPQLSLTLTDRRADLLLRIGPAAVAVLSADEPRSYVHRL